MVLVVRPTGMTNRPPILVDGRRANGLRRPIGRPSRQYFGVGDVNERTGFAKQFEIKGLLGPLPLSEIGWMTNHLYHGYTPSLTPGCIAQCGSIRGPAPSPTEPPYGRSVIRPRVFRRPRASSPRVSTRARAFGPTWADGALLAAAFPAAAAALVCSWAYANTFATALK